MNQILAFIYYGIQAEANNFFEFLGPLLLFGIYILGALAKSWSKKRDLGSDEEKPSSELQKAVKKRYQQIYERQTGKTPTLTQMQTSRTEQPQFVRKPVEEIEPVKPRQQVSPTNIPESKQRYQKAQPKRMTRPPVVQKRTFTQPSKRMSKPYQVRKATVDIPAKHTFKPTCDYLIKMIQEPQNLRSAIILKEILDKPVGLRDL
jgi:hypothetical protein